MLLALFPLPSLSVWTQKPSGRERGAGPYMDDGRRATTLPPFFVSPLILFLSAHSLSPCSLSPPSPTSIPTASRTSTFWGRWRAPFKGGGERDQKLRKEKGDIKGKKERKREKETGMMGMTKMQHLTMRWGMTKMQHLTMQQMTKQHLTMQHLTCPPRS